MRFTAFALVATAVALNLKKSSSYEECADEESDYCNMYYGLVDQQASDAQSANEAADKSIDSDRKDDEKSLNSTIAYHNDTINMWYEMEQDRISAANKTLNADFENMEALAESSYADLEKWAADEQDKLDKYYDGVQADIDAEAEKYEEESSDDDADAADADDADTDADADADADAADESSNSDYSYNSSDDSSADQEWTWAS